MTQDLVCYVLFSLLALVLCEELTFNLPDNDKMCFYEDIDANVKCTLEFQVSQIEGSHTLACYGGRGQKTTSCQEIQCSVLTKENHGCSFYKILSKDGQVLVPHSLT